MLFCIFHEDEWSSILKVNNESFCRLLINKLYKYSQVLPRNNLEHFCLSAYPSFIKVSQSLHKLSSQGWINNFLGSYDAFLATTFSFPSPEIENFAYKLSAEFIIPNDNKPKNFEVMFPALKHNMLEAGPRTFEKNFIWNMLHSITPIRSLSHNIK